jgi:hypothetical protein
MDLFINSRSRHSRRDMLKSSALAMLPFALRSGDSSFFDPQTMTANGGTDPYPIPWLDKNGSHNQAAGPTSNLHISTTSKVESPVAAPLQAWARTIKETASLLALLPPTTA